MRAPTSGNQHDPGAARPKRAMRVSYLVIALAIAAVVAAAALFEWSGVGPPEQPPITDRPIATNPPLPTCIGLQGRELERCQVLKQVRPGDYEKGAPDQETDASFNSARAKRGTGIEGVSSAGITADPPN